MDHDADEDGGREEENDKDDKQRLIREVKGGERKTERERKKSCAAGTFPQ